MTLSELPITRPDSRSRSLQQLTPATFAERLNRLFDIVYPPGRGPFTSAELVTALNAHGFQISAPYVSQLRSGSRTHPSASTLEGIAAFFRIDSAYFTDPEYYQLVDQQLTALDAMRDPAVRRVATRVVGLSGAAIDEIMNTVEELRGEEHPAGPEG